jgi:NOL1/NOP2/sun family putative RNA methylase
MKTKRSRKREEQKINTHNDFCSDNCDITVYDLPSTELSKKLAEKYGYNEFIVRRWLAFFGEECEEIMRAFEEEIPRYIRVNTLKIEEERLIRKMEKRGFLLKKTEIKYCYEVVKEPYSIGATPEYLMGYYYIMDKSSCVPPLVLDPQPGEIIADLAASPGGKTTFISQLMGNSGVVFAVEPQTERIQPLIDNVNRMGAMNVLVVKMDARDFARKLIEEGVEVDRVLLDAPCTGEGIIHKDKTRKTSRGASDIKFCSSLQRELILAGFDILKEDGKLVYSTCSLTPEENEYVIDFLLDHRDCSVENIELEIGSPSLLLPDLKHAEEIRKTKRLYPHRHRTSGFFVAKIRKR